MYQATSTFSPPLSDRTREGRPKVSTADWKSCRTVKDLLFVEQCRNIIMRENPSIPAWITNLHLLKKINNKLNILNKESCGKHAETFFSDYWHMKRPSLSTSQRIGIVLRNVMQGNNFFLLFRLCLLFNIYSIFP